MGSPVRNYAYRRIARDSERGSVYNGAAVGGESPSLQERSSG
jgi:hypothetical protein